MAKIIKRPRKNGNYSWVVDFRDNSGRRIKKTVDGNRRDAEALLTQIKTELGQNSFVSFNQRKPFEVLAKAYLTSKSGEISENTADDYRRLLRLHLLPFFRGFRIQQIARERVEAFRAQMIERKKGIRTINKSMTLLKSLFNYALVHGWMARNPAIGIKQLRETDPTREKPFQSHVLKPEEFRALLNSYDANHERWKIIVEVAGLTGLREGELLGLRWGDINWKTKQIQLERQYTKGRFCGLKTVASRRSVDISDEVVLHLKKWWLACPKGSLGLVFPNGVGNPENHANLLRRGFYPFLQKAGLRKIRFHDLRHTYASLLIMNGEHPKYIQQQLGHSSVKVTMDIYGHLMQSSNPQAAEKLSKLIYGQDAR